MGILDRAVVFACDFKPRIVNGLSVCPNFGRAAGSPSFLTLGDGATATTFPTPLAGFGATFDGGDYVNTGVVDRYEYTDQFSLYFYGSVKEAGNQYLITTVNTVGFRGIFLYTSGTRTLDIYASNNGTTNIVRRRFFYGTETASFAASKYSSFKNAIAGGSTITNELSASIKTGFPFRLGLRQDNGGGMIGRAYAFGIFDGLLTPSDIVTLDTLVKSGIR